MPNKEYQVILQEFEIVVHFNEGILSTDDSCNFQAVLIKRKLVQMSVLADPYRIDFQIGVLVVEV